MFGLRESSTIRRWRWTLAIVAVAVGSALAVLLHKGSFIEQLPEVLIVGVVMFFLAPELRRLRLQRHRSETPPR